MGYGIFLSEEDKQRMRENNFKYLEAIIKAEESNPDPDYDNARTLKLLRQIAECDCDYFDRRKLVHLLLGNEE